MEEFDVPGDWWLPGEPDAVAPGRLRDSQQDGATLDLLEELSRPGANCPIGSAGVAE